MSNQDRLATLIAEHQWYVSPAPTARGGYCLGCLAVPTPVAGTAPQDVFASFREYAAHLAVLIARADDVAVDEQLEGDKEVLILEADALLGLMTPGTWGERVVRHLRDAHAKAVDDSIRRAIEGKQ